MRTCFTVLGAAALLCACTSTEMKDARDRWGENPSTNPDFMAAFMELNQPADAHVELAKGAGRWVVRGKLFMEPGAPPEEMNGTANVRMALGGRYLIEEFHSEFMGQPFEGLLVMGHDNLTGEFFSIWMDNMSTAPSIAEGAGGEDGNMELEGMMKDMITPSGRPYRLAITHHSDTKYVMEMYDTNLDGDEWKVMELVYTR